MIVLSLPYRPPLDWTLLLAWLGPRAIPGVEAVADGRYRRTFAAAGRHGVLEVGPAPDGPRLVATIRGPAGRGPAGAGDQVAARLGRLFDLAADPGAIDRGLAGDPLLAPLVAARPGLRVPGAWDPFELAVRAVLGQQISVRAATVLAGRVAERYGAPLALDDGAPAPPGLGRVFPGPEALLAADPGILRLPSARARTLAALARAVLDEPDLLAPGQALEPLVERLCRLPGIGPWTAHYVALRALGLADAFPSGDLGLRKAAADASGLPTAPALLARAEAWRPWRGYAARQLWHSLGAGRGG